MLIKYEQISIN